MAKTYLGTDSLDDTDIAASQITTGILDDARIPSGITRDSELAAYAPLASPALTGTPTAPTPSQGDNDTSIATTAFVNTEIAADAAPKDLGGVFASASAALSLHSPNNLTMEQWGEEEAVIAQADCPASAVVIGWLTGAAGAGPGSPGVGDTGEYKLEVSFDGGSSWADLGDAGIRTVILNTGAGVRLPIAAVGRATGTVTGDVQVRAMCRDVNQANDFTFQDGTIVAMVHPQ